MPELPEVETVCRGLAPVMEGARIAAVEQRRADLRAPFPAGLPARLTGRRVDSVRRRAKYILIHLEGGDVLALHLGMSGRILIKPAGAAYVPGRHDHLILRLDSGAGIVFNDARRFGVALLLEKAGMAAHPAFAGLGPEPLEEEFSGPVLASRLKGRKTAIKQALLDQRVVAGIGNIYACEALYESGIDPRLSAGKLSAARARVLVNAVRDVLTRAIAAGGSSLRDYRQANGEAGYFQHSFSVYGREGETCPSCRGKGGIRRIVQGGRSTFFCPRCQT